MKNLFGEETGRPRVKREGASKKNGKKPEQLGCEHCTLNEVPGVNKLINIDRIKGRKVFVWAQTPGAKENEEGLELIGTAGQFLWSELKEVGITREQCDIQNVVRCAPLTSPDGNTPTKAQIKCCSVFNDQAIEKNRNEAVVHLILGKIAGVQLLGKLYSKAKAAVWHEGWNAYVVVADHPSRVLRSGGKKAGWIYLAFKDKMKAVKAILDNPGRWGYVNAQEYGAVTTPAEMCQLKEFIYGEAAWGRRVSVDIEDCPDGKGGRKMLMVGFGWGEYEGKTRSGGARSVVLYHPEAEQTSKRLQPILADLRQILEDPNIKKIMHYGSSDVEAIKNELGFVVRGYDYDSMYAVYLWMSHLRKYGLDSLVGYFHPQFADYKDMCRQWMEDLSKAPLDLLVTYNCGDCDVTKRIECQTRDKISHPLLQVYVNAAFTLRAMERRGPILDRAACQKIIDFVGPRVQQLTRKLQSVSDDPDFNPNTPQRVAKLLYGTLKLPLPTDPKTKKLTRSTGKDALDFLCQKSKHPAIRLVQRYRKVSKMETSLRGYEKSADLNGGELRTIWWLTGAATGRLRSGKSEKAEVETGVMNFQNLYKNAVMKNPLVSDKNWRKALEE